MPTNKNRKKIKWFNDGVEAFVRARPDAPRLYCCPICIRGFDNPNELTFEDVPPQSVGGKPLVLTCPNCNHWSGRLLDTHIRTGCDLHEFAEGKRDTRIKLIHSGDTITAKALLAQGQIQITGLPENSDPKAHRSLFEKLDKVASKGLKSWELSLEFIEFKRHNPWREAVGWLRVAYLYTFAALGYNFIMRPELNIIREQFQRPDDRIAPQAMQSIRSPSTDNGLSFLYSPPELRSIVVRLGVNLFFFPAFVESSKLVDSSTLYERIASYLSLGQKLTISGTHIDLPKRPQFAFDYLPRSIFNHVAAGGTIRVDMGN